MSDDGDELDGFGGGIGFGNVEPGGFVLGASGSLDTDSEDDLGGLEGCVLKTTAALCYWTG